MEATPVYISIEDVRAFFTAECIHSFDPDSKLPVAQITYLSDGTCRAEFVDGQSDTGTWGFTEQGYWTCYRTFRQGKRHVFHLERIAPHVMQAFHADGSRAFVQTPLEALLDGLSDE